MGGVLDEYLVVDHLSIKNIISEIKQNITTARKALKEGIELKSISISNITGIDETSIEIIKKKYC
ncbi:hypothetical protein [Lysinibacillus sp. NPDC093692]|uniref:hypothetical protein n=1 Tax=Lysinibacillus sp. NPDC093692 TaxID=3390578 RepID=UPI003D034DF4